DEAMQQLDQAVRLSMPDIERAQYLYLAQRYEECLKAADRALANHISDAKIYRIRGQALMRLERYREAVTAFAGYRNCAGRPDTAIGREQGLAHLRLGEYLAAVDDYSVVLATQPDGDLYLQRGWAYFFADAWKFALRDFQQALAANPKQADAYV